MIHQVIYDTMHLALEEVVSIVGAGDPATVIDRRVAMEKFLASNEWNLEKYKLWHAQEARTKLPAASQMAMNVARAATSAVLSGLKEVTLEEQKRRHDICKYDCMYYRTADDRCAKCGCYTTFKSRLVAWHCPIEKW